MRDPSCLFFVIPNSVHTKKGNIALKNSNLTAIEQQIWRKLNPQKVMSDVGRYERIALSISFANFDVRSSKNEI